MLKFGALVAALSLSFTPAMAKGSKVVVDGQTYRVVTKGREVYVYNKAALVKFTPLEYERRRRAVRLATGCEITNGDRLEISYAGLLDCSGESAKE